jgi:hypothetical protein
MLDALKVITVARVRLKLINCKPRGKKMLE